MLTYEEYAKIRDSKGLKDGRVAELAGIGRSTFSDWKSGRSVPKEAKLMKIAAALGVTYASMVGWEQLSLFDDKELFPDKSTMALEHIIALNDEKGGSSKLAEFLYDNTVRKPDTKSSTNINITNEEYELIKQFRKADASTKDVIVRLLAFAASQESENKK